MAKKVTKTAFKPGNQAAVGHSEGKTGAPTKAAKAAIRELLTVDKEIERPDKTKEVVNIHDQAIRTLHAALKGRDELGNPTPAAVRAVELVLSYVHGPPKKDDADQRPPMTLVVNCAPIVNNQLNVGGHNHA